MPNLTEEILDINTLTEVTKVGGGGGRVSLVIGTV
jgi:hypothetical protein